MHAHNVKARSPAAAHPEGLRVHPKALPNSTKQPAAKAREGSTAGAQSARNAASAVSVPCPCRAAGLAAS
eukprot:7309807-Alexandrium_andersonii.AAC.1